MRDAIDQISPSSGQSSHYEINFYGSYQSISSSTKAGASTVTTGYTSINSAGYGAALIQVSVKESTGGGGASTAVTATTSLPAFSGGASMASASATVTATTSLPSYSGGATGDTSSGTLTLPVLKNNTDTALPTFSGQALGFGGSAAVNASTALPVFSGNTAGHTEYTRAPDGGGAAIIIPFTSRPPNLGGRRH